MTCGIVGLVLFPLACVAALAQIVGPVVFVFVAAVAAALVFASVAKLEASHP